jgi:hypothetical protein
MDQREEGSRPVLRYTVTCRTLGGSTRRLAGTKEGARGREWEGRDWRQAVRTASLLLAGNVRVVGSRCRAAVDGIGLFWAKNQHHASQLSTWQVQEEVGHLAMVSVH